MKKISLLLVIVLLFGVLAGCGGSAKDPGMDTIVSSLEKILDPEGKMLALDSDFMKNIMGLSEEMYADANLKKTSVGTAIDEYGILKGADSKQAAEIKKAVEAYVKMRQDTWMSEYLPEEFPKLENAVVAASGNYVIYIIASEEMRAAAVETFSGLFK